MEQAPQESSYAAHDSAGQGTPRRRLDPWVGALIVGTLMLLGGLAGLIAGAALAGSVDEGVGAALAALVSGTPLAGEFLAILILGAVGFVAAGFVVGGWIGIALVTFRRHGVACPRCGTLTEFTASRCEACDLPLTLAPIAS